MWWQIIPSFTIVTVCYAIPVVTTLSSAYVYYGSKSGRELDTQFKEYRLWRDERILGIPLPLRQHKYLGLDGIPDD